MIMGETQLHFVSAVVILLAAAVPIYLTIKLKDEKMKKLTAILSIFIGIHAIYQIVGFYGLNLLAEGVLEPLSVGILIFFGIFYSGMAKQRNTGLKNIAVVLNPGTFLLLMDSITIMLLFVALGIFVWLAARSKSIRTFQFQISIFIIIWVLGDLISLLHDNGVVIFSGLPKEFGSEIHLVSMLFFSAMLWLRYYYSDKSTKRIVEDVVDTSS
jgi:hypothetical protein